MRVSFVHHTLMALWRQNNGLFLKNNMIQNDSSYLDPPFGMPNGWELGCGRGSEDTSPAFNTGSPTAGEAEEDSPNSPKCLKGRGCPDWNGKEPFSQDSALRHVCF